MSSTLRAAPMNFTPMDFYSVGVFLCPNFAHAITEETGVVEFLDMLIQSELNKYIIYLKTIGLQGLETEHPNLSMEERYIYHEYCKELDLLESGGTDYHGIDIKPDIEIEQKYGAEDRQLNKAIEILKTK